jgi:hypothetical protein
VRKQATQQLAEGPPTEEVKRQAVNLPTQDDYVAKLAKYVPGEVVAVSLAGFAAFNPTGRWVWAALVGAVAINLIYLAAAAVKLPAGSRPRAYFYVLSGVALVFWAVATIPQVRDKFGLGGQDGQDKASYILVFAAFGIPLVDTLFASLEVRVKGDAPPPAPPPV